MKSILISGLMILSAFFLASCNEQSSAVGTNTDNTADKNERVYPVRIQKVEKQNITRTLEYTADLIPFVEIHFAPSSPGRIDEILVDIGNKVTKGQVLVEMDKTQLKQAESQLAIAAYNFKGSDTLYRLGSISEQQYEQAKTQYEIAKSTVEHLSENTTMLSPVNGIVTEKYYENGELYSGAPTTSSGKAAIISIMQISPLKAIVNVSQTFYPNIKKGMRANITTDIYPENIFQGTVYKVHPTINSDTRTFKIEIIIPNNNETLRPGMFANIEIELEDAESLMVPAIAILKQEGTNNRYVFINKNGIAKQIEVHIGKRIDDKIELKTNGISEGTDLIIEGQANLMDGSRVNVINN